MSPSSGGAFASADDADFVLYVVADVEVEQVSAFHDAEDECHVHVADDLSC
jgi:hypothetical protein